MSMQGRHGEALFASLCQNPKANIESVLNVAANDEHGWDHIVDLKPPKNLDLPADLHDHLLQCFVQIKTTKRHSPTTKVKLSNAIKAAKSPNPSFIFLFHYKADTPSPILYGKKIWRNEIERSLKRAREISVSDPSRNLYEVYLSMSFEDEDVISDHPSDWMLKEIAAHGGANYSINKLAIVNSVGYGEFTNEIKFTFPPTVSANDIVV